MAEIDERGDEELRRTAHDLGERVKELACLYGVANALRRSDDAIDELFDEVVELLPPGWHYPEITCARIRLNERDYATDNFIETSWRQASDVLVNEQRVGCVEVYYLEERPQLDEGVFLEEERSLIDNIAAMLGQFLERRGAEEALRRQNSKIRALFDLLPNLVFTYVKQGDDFVLGEANAAFRNLGNGREEELLGRRASELMTGEVEFLKALHTAHAERRSVEAIEKTHWMRSTGELRTMRASFTFIDADSVLVVAEDITDRKQAEDKIRASLREKDLLLAEVHHRVKNNLQIIASLLQLQLRKLEEGPARQALMSGRQRVHTMASIHEQLYQTSDFSAVDMQPYTRRLADSLRGSFSSGAIELSVEVADIKLPIDRAIPCGLVLNELISNSLEHGFCGGKSGHIQVRLERQTEGGEVRCALTVSDDGVGLPKGLDLQALNTLGLELVRMLSRQLGGTVEIDGTRGTTVTVLFPLPKEGIDAAKASLSDESSSQGTS